MAAIKREHFATIRREVVLHRMVTAVCPDDRLYWAIILWSWCGPERSSAGAVVKKTQTGFIRKDTQGRPEPAKLKDLCELMEWPPGMKGEVTRIVKRLIENNLITFDKTEGILYAVEEPSLPEISKPVAGTRNWCIGRRVIGTRNLPSDPEARYRAIQWLDEASTAWKNDLKLLRTRYRDMLVSAAPDLGILIREEKKSRGERTSSSPPSSNGHGAVVVEEEDEPQIIEVAEEPRAVEVLPAVIPPPAPVPAFDEFKQEYPGEVDPASKRAFERLPPAEKIACMRSLPGYKACGRWQNLKFIPRASRFIGEEFWKFEPPPDRAPEDPKMASRKTNMAETLAWARVWGKT